MGAYLSFPIAQWLSGDCISCPIPGGRQPLDEARGKRQGGEGMGGEERERRRSRGEEEEEEDQSIYKSIN